MEGSGRAPTPSSPDGEGRYGRWREYTLESAALQTNPLERADLGDFVACYIPENHRDRKETVTFKCFSYHDLPKRDK